MNLALQKLALIPLGLSKIELLALGAAGILPLQDSFTDTNGVKLGVHVPDLGGPWDVGSDTWEIQANAAENTPGLGSELVTNGDMELDANWLDEGSPTVNERSNTQAHGGTYSRKFTADSASDGIRQTTVSVTAGKLYKINSWVYPDDNAGVKMAFYDGTWILNSYMPGLNQDAWNNIVRHIRAVNTQASSIIKFDSYSISSGDWYIDDVSIKEVTVNDLYASADMKFSSGQWDMTITADVGAWAGHAICLDGDPSTGAASNYLLIYLDRVDDTIHVEKWLAGSLDSTLIDTSVTYGAGKILRVTKSANSVDVYYSTVAGDTQVGTTQTVSDAAITSNTRHGILSTDGASIDDYVGGPL